MAIEKAKVVFSEIGIHMPSLAARKKMYMVYADVQVSTQKKHLRVNIVEGGLFVSKKVPTKVFVCEHFFVVLYESKYMFFNEEGQKTAEKTHDEVGDVISVWEDNFVTHIGDDMLQFDGKGELEGRRPFTDEEKSQLKAAGLI